MNEFDRITERMAALETALTEAKAENLKLRAQHEKLLEEIGGLVVEKAELQKQIERMKHCRNCANEKIGNPCKVVKENPLFFRLTDCIDKNHAYWKPKEESTYEKSQG